ncbi:BatA domain-containing protein [bacterium]|nr:BatA domain-containing protein [bacterium]
MIFHHPWGLLALLSLPVIVGLHFFRSRKEVRRVGGLYLWEFARQRPPVGARWDRLIRSASLLFQLLAATVASLLLAGLDLPREGESRHFAVVVDDSLSMSAGVAETSAERARKALLGWAEEKDRFTLIAAGARPRLLCEPFSRRAELAAALETWRPLAPTADFAAASALAGKFLVGDEKTLCVTDHVAAATAWQSVLELWGVGQSLGNNAIVFADRVRIGPRRDRILARITRFADNDATVELTALAGGQPFHRENLTLLPDRAAALAFETGAVDVPIELRLPEDPLVDDHVVVLAPVEPKPVRVACLGPARFREYARRATLAVRDTFFLEDAGEADLVFIAGATEAPRARHVCRLPASASGLPLALAQGKDLFVDHGDRRVSDLPLDGLLWAWFPGLSPAPGRRLIEHATQPLLVAAQPAPRRVNYDLYLAWERTNLFRHTAWPVLVQAMIEHCREDLPGMDRSNYRVGETVRVNLDEESDGGWTLLCNGVEVRRYETAPDMLSELPPGLYQLSRGGTMRAQFAVNLFASGESDLRPLESRAADTRALVPSVVRETETHRRLFFALTALLILFAGSGWACQDRAR